VKVGEAQKARVLFPESAMVEFLRRYTQPAAVEWLPRMPGLAGVR
jgi:hypothetical protein